MLELLIAVGLIALNGVFALSELAVVSARKVRLTMMAEQGRPGARAALSLAEEPGRFLSIVQIGITLVGILAGAFSGAALGARMTGVMEGWGVPGRAAEPLGYGLVIGLITYFSVVVGELVPKRLALRNAEAIACVVAPGMRLLSRLASPLVGLLDGSSTLVFRILGLDGESANAVTEEEVRSIVAEAASSGAIESDERKMISGVLRLGDRNVRAIMTPRTEVEWIDVTDDEEKIRAQLIDTVHSRLPACDGDPDNMLGVIPVRELLTPFLRGEAMNLRNHIRPAPVIPDTLDALDAVTALQQADSPMALVYDEYGHFDGVVTPADVLDAIAGAFRSDEGGDEPEAVQRADGSWLLAGWMPADEMADLLRIVLPERRDYQTVAGLVIGALERLPTAGDTVDTLGWRFEVVDMDGRRLDKVLAWRLGDEAESADDAA